MCVKKSCRYLDFKIMIVKVKISKPFNVKKNSRYIYQNVERDVELLVFSNTRKC